MKKIMATVLVLGFSQFVFAEQFRSTVHSIDLGKSNQDHLVRFDNGRVSFIDPDDVELVNALVLSNENDEVVEVKVDKKNNVVAAQTIFTVKVESVDEGEQESSFDNRSSFKPTVVKNTNAALAIFNKMRKDYTAQGQCYNRAHIWAYEEYNRSKLNSMKIFMFFTERYIRKYKFHWWFHVTPMTYVGNLTSPRTLDRRYTSGPRQTKTWSDVFIKSKRTCKKVNKFDDFWLNQQKEDCYHIHTSMYYVIPRDIEKRDLTGIEKTEFKEKEIRRAYNDAFKKKP